MLATLRRIFVVGVIAAAPLGVTIYLILKIFFWFDSIFQPWVPVSFPGLGLIVGVTFIFVIGLVAPSLLGRQILRMLERLVERLPLVKLVYSGIKQIFDSFSQSHPQKFSRVVLVPYPHNDSYTIGFVTNEAKTSLVEGHPDKKLSVFVPTTPNPTSGFLLFFSEAQTKRLPMSVEEALKLVISVGMAGHHPQKNQ